MKELVNTSQAAPVTPAVNSLNDFLKDYNPVTQPVTIQNGSAPAPQTLSAPVAQTIEYYKTGKKAGQPKPNRAKQPAYTAPAISSPVQQTSSVNGTLITGALFIMLIDLVMPALIAFINNQTTKVQIKASMLGLDDKQKKDFEKLADEAVKQLNIQANPMILLSISMGGIYMMNVFLQRSLEEQKMKAAKPAPNVKPVY